MIKYYKFGFGRVSDYVNEDIRNGRISRNDGISLVERYDNSCSDEYILNFCNYIGINKDQFWEQVFSSLNKDLFSVDASGVIQRKFKVGVGL
jgi:hypothetical protein